MFRSSVGRAARRLVGPVALVAALALLLSALSAGAPLAARAASPNPLATRPLYVDPDTWASWVLRRGVSTSAEVRTIAAVPQAHWVTSGTATKAVAAEVSRYVSAATWRRKLPVLTVYAIPNRDCGGYSAGGLTSATAYRAWIAQVVKGIGARATVVVLEPDALTSLDCLSAGGRSARYAMLADAVRQLSAVATTTVYVDAGHSAWLPAAEAAKRLKAVGVGRARGFSLNVSNFQTTAHEIAYGEQVSALLGGQHYVVDTSRNGLGPAPSAPLNWCNPAGRALGPRPGTKTAGAHADAYLWIKHPGESDGDCGRGEPQSGHWFEGYAVGLVERSVNR